MTASSLRQGAWAVACWLALLHGVHAAIFESAAFHAGSTVPARDEWGTILPGSATSPDCAVQLLWATNGIAYPPAVDGTPHAGNAPVDGGRAWIGRLTSPAETNSGQFGLVIERGPPSGKVFLRVFNHSDPAQATFYGDSRLFTISGANEFNANYLATTNPLDTGDDDDDGLVNSWEDSYGSDRDDPDSDGDGLEDGVEHSFGSNPLAADSDADGSSDQNEYRAGTLPGDPSSFLGLAAMEAADVNLVIRWASTSGKVYQIEANTGSLLTGVFTSITEAITAEVAASTTETTLTNVLQPGGPLLYRVLLVEEPP